MRVWLVLWWAMMLGGCAPECECDSTISVALTDAENELLGSGGRVRLCVEDTCLDFGAPFATYDWAATASDGKSIVTYATPQRLVFITGAVRGGGPHPVELDISDGRTSLVRRWPAVDFTEREADPEYQAEAGGDSGVCTPACVRAYLP